MLHESINSELLVELSDEQQQVVTGGNLLGGTPIKKIDDTLATFYKTNTAVLDLNVAQASTSGGSTNLQRFAIADLKIDTAAHKQLLARL